MSVASDPAERGGAVGLSESTAVVIIEPSRGWTRIDYRELWAYRELFWVLLSRDVRVRYQQTILGVAWAVLRPLLSTGVFTLIFGRLAKLPSEGAPYALFALAGVVPWTFFSSAVAGASDSLVGSQHLVSKIYFPRVLIPLSTVGTCFVDFAVGAALLVALALASGFGGVAAVLWLPLLVLLLAFSCLGIGLLLSALNVAYRDVRHLVPFGMQLWLYATPVVYPPALVPERYRWLLYLNPAAGPIEAFRAVFLARAADWQGIALSLAVALALLLAGALYFGRVERDFADVI